MTVAATDKGLCYLGLAEDSEERMKACMADEEFFEDEERLASVSAEITKFLSGETKRLTVSTDLTGSPFQLAVWEALCNIPYGRTATYSEIAGSIGRPDAVRAVASAIGKNPLLLAVPCHRVIGKDGRLSGFRDGTEKKARLIRLEREVLQTPVDKESDCDTL